MVPLIKVHILMAGALTLLNLWRRKRHWLQMLLQKMEISPKLIKIALFFSRPWGINFFCVCPLQRKETQNQSSSGSQENQSSKESRAAPHQSDGHSAAAKSTDSVSKHACLSNEMSSTSTDMLGNGTGVTPDGHNDHKTGLCVRNCLTPSVVGKPTGSGHVANLTLNLGHYNNEEKQDQSKDGPLPELRQEEGCECKCKLVLWWPITCHFLDIGCSNSIWMKVLSGCVIFLSSGANGRLAVCKEWFLWERHRPDGGKCLHEGHLQGHCKGHFQGTGFYALFPDEVLKHNDEYTISLFMPLEPFSDSYCVIFLVVPSSDGNFLRLHSDCGPNTHFKWQVKLR